jgi:aminoglycoside phosphotransferase (APT) family kinase protein
MVTGVSPARAAAGNRPTKADFVAPDEIVAFDREALARHLAALGLDFDPTTPIRQFAGGFANRNYLVEVNGALCVLRRPPAGPLPLGAHDMAREHKILQALSPVLPFVPTSRHFCPDKAVIGAPFQLIEYRSGLVVRNELPFGLPAQSGATLSEMLVRTLAAVHAVDVEACGLGDLGRPERFIERTIQGWGQRGREVSEGRPALAVGDLTTWLMAQKLSDRRPALLHLDFKLDNIVLDPGTLQPRALIDWDMGTRGDPLFDLATLLTYWPEASDPPELAEGVTMPTRTGGFWTRQQVSERYGDLVGLALDDLPILRVLALMKLGVVMLQLDRQWTTGAVKGDRYGSLRAQGEYLLVHALDLTRGG